MEQQSTDAEEYDWDLIIKMSLPVSLLVAWAYYSDISNFLKWLSLFSGACITAWLVYRKSKRKGNIFTAAAIVFLAAIVVKYLKAWSFI
jgi:hypothetical protein